ncbi:hypothetical protein ACLB2K_065626 [Fragaria x ananassa]
MAMRTPWRFLLMVPCAPTEAKMESFCCRIWPRERGCTHLMLVRLFMLYASAPTGTGCAESEYPNKIGNQLFSVNFRRFNILLQISVEESICKFAKKGMTPSQIGVILRDSHGFAQMKSVTGSKILRILKAQDMQNYIEAKEVQIALTPPKESKPIKDQVIKSRNG